MCENGVSSGGVNIKDQWVTESLFVAILLEHSQIILYSSSLPYVYSVILSYSLSLGSDCLSVPSFCLFKDSLKLSTQILTWSENKALPSPDRRTSYVWSCPHTSSNSLTDNLKKTHYEG